MYCLPFAGIVRVYICANSINIALFFRSPLKHVSLLYVCFLFLIRNLCLRIRLHISNLFSTNQLELTPPSAYTSTWIGWQTTTTIAIKQLPCELTMMDGCCCCFIFIAHTMIHWQWRSFLLFYHKCLFYSFAFSCSSS